MKKKIFAVALAAAMTVTSAMTAFAADSYYSFDKDAGQATVTGAKMNDAATVTAPVIKDGKLVLDGTYGLKLPEKITGDTYTVSFKVNYNAVTANTATVFVYKSIDNADAIWHSLGYGWNTTLKPGIWAHEVGGTPEWTDIFSTTEFETGKEYTLTFVVDKLAASVYVDGEKVAEGTVPSVAGAEICIGVNNWDAAANCTLDDLVILDGTATSDVSKYITNTPAAGTGTNTPAAGTGTNTPAAGTGTNAPAAGTGTNAPAAGTGTNAPAGNGNAGGATTGDVAPYAVAVLAVAAAAVVVVLQKKKVTE